MTSAKIVDIVPPVICARCDEVIGPGEAGDELIEAAFGLLPQRFHYECRARMAIGGMNHLLGRCTCCGGTEPPDPPELTKREAARNALAVFRAQQAQRKGDESGTHAA